MFKNYLVPNIRLNDIVGSVPDKGMKDEWRMSYGISVGRTLWLWWMQQVCTYQILFKQRKERVKIGSGLFMLYRVIESSI